MMMMMMARMLMMTVVDGDASDAYRKWVTSDCQAPGKESPFQAARKKSARFCQHFIWKV